MTSQELILKQNENNGIEVRSRVPNKKYKSERIYELIQIANFLQN